MRKIICADALKWLDDNKNIGGIICGLPDLAEMEGVINNYKDYELWFSQAITKCLLSLSEGVPAIFCQTDRKIDFRWLSKSTIIINAARALHMKILFHKIIVRNGINKIDLYRPGYSFLIAVGDENCKPGKATADVIERGGVIYDNGFPINAAHLSLDFLKGKTKTIVDPFCGRGTIPYLAEQSNFDSIGIDIDKNQCDIAAKLQGLDKKFTKNKNKTSFFNSANKDVVSP